ncbi:hypothetical protein SEVIR_5G417801v4 [Setaria viridis]
MLCSLSDLRVQAFNGRGLMSVPLTNCMMQGGGMSDMASFALSGSLVLITCLRPDTVTARVKIFPEILRCCIHAAVCLWWILQTASTTFRAFAVPLRERLCMQILDHIGMLGAIHTCWPCVPAHQYVLVLVIRLMILLQR